MRMGRQQFRAGVDGPDGQNVGIPCATVAEHNRLPAGDHRSGILLAAQLSVASILCTQKGRTKYAFKVFRDRRGSGRHRDDRQSVTPPEHVVPTT